MCSPLTVCNYQRTCSFTKLSVVCPFTGPHLAFEGETSTPDSLRFPGSFAAVVPPVPIPNTAVKRCRADGSACIACARVGRCRGILEKPAFRDQRGLFISKAWGTVPGFPPRLCVDRGSK